MNSEIVYAPYPPIKFDDLIKPFSMKVEYHWSIKKYGYHRWILMREEICSSFSFVNSQPICRIFDTEQEAIEAMVLEKLEY